MTHSTHTLHPYDPMLTLVPHSRIHYLYLVAVARLRRRLHRCCHRHSRPLRLPPPSSPSPSPTLSPLPSPSSLSLALVAVAVALAAVTLALFVARHPRRRRRRPCHPHPLLHPRHRRSLATLVTRRHLPFLPRPLRRCPHHPPGALVVRCRLPSCSCPPPDFATPVAS